MYMAAHGPMLSSRRRLSSTRPQQSEVDPKPPLISRMVNGRSRGSAAMHRGQSSTFACTKRLALRHSSKPGAAAGPMKADGVTALNLKPMDSRQEVTNHARSSTSTSRSTVRPLTSPRTCDSGPRPVTSREEGSRAHGVGIGAFRFRCPRKVTGVGGVTTSSGGSFAFGAGLSQGLVNPGVLTSPKQKPGLPGLPLIDVSTLGSRDPLDRQRLPCCVLTFDLCRQCCSIPLRDFQAGSQRKIQLGPVPERPCFECQCLKTEILVVARMSGLRS